mmetsp:Transcript_9829/g.36657  ORF Transcript_9829/g.36657 Transcript_9829/m.36657 type:complete len:279 (-) Transcript_9829:1662-2498(-)
MSPPSVALGDSSDAASSGVVVVGSSSSSFDSSTTLSSSSCAASSSSTSKSSSISLAISSPTSKSAVKSSSRSRSAAKSSDSPTFFSSAAAAGLEASFLVGDDLVATAGLDASLAAGAALFFFAGASEFLETRPALETAPPRAAAAAGFDPPAARVLFFPGAGAALADGLSGLLKFGLRFRRSLIWRALLYAELVLFGAWPPASSPPSSWSCSSKFSFSCLCFLASMACLRFHVESAFVEILAFRSSSSLFLRSASSSACNCSTCLAELTEMFFLRRIS